MDDRFFPRPPGETYALVDPYTKTVSFMRTSDNGPVRCPAPAGWQSEFPGYKLVKRTA